MPGVALPPRALTLPLPSAGSPDIRVVRLIQPFSCHFCPRDGEEQFAACDSTFVLFCFFFFPFFPSLFVFCFQKLLEVLL